MPVAVAPLGLLRVLVSPVSPSVGALSQFVVGADPEPVVAFNSFNREQFERLRIMRYLFAEFGHLRLVNNRHQSPFISYPAYCFARCFGVCPGFAFRGQIILHVSLGGSAVTRLLFSREGLL